MEKCQIPRSSEWDKIRNEVQRRLDEMDLTPEQQRVAERLYNMADKRELKGELRGALAVDRKKEYIRNLDAMIVSMKKSRENRQQQARQRLANLLDRVNFNQGTIEVLRIAVALCDKEKVEKIARDFEDALDKLGEVIDALREASDSETPE